MAMSTQIFALYFYFFLELKYPDDEDIKNQFIPCGSSLDETHMSWGLDSFFSAYQDQLVNADNLQKMLGKEWIRKSRLSGFKFFGEENIERVIENVEKNKDKMVEKLDAVLKNYYKSYCGMIKNNANEGLTIARQGKARS